LICIASCNECYPQDADLSRTFEECRELGIDALFSGSDGAKLLLVGQSYDDLYIAVYLPREMPVAAAARDLRRILSAGPECNPGEPLLPANDVSSTLGRWERKISRIFGDKYAAKLLEQACLGLNHGHMTKKSLEEVRRSLISATGGCIDFAES
ncbi:MAG TPA: hypothetical protein VK436_12230, partial [Methanocella sp.]|nr:hypothetical protein [Methanocella sp.]